MHEKILSNTSQLTLATFLLTAPPRVFAVGELSKRLRLSEAKLQGGLQKLREAGVAMIYRKGNARYWGLNLKYKYLDELKRSVPKRASFKRDNLFSAISQLGKIRAAFLSGLFTGQAQLPVDILLVGKISLTKMQKFLDAWQKIMQNEINYSIMSDKEFAMRRDTFDRFIKDIFDYPHVVVQDSFSKTKKVPKPVPFKFSDF